MNTTDATLPRLAIFISNQELLLEVENTLRDHYSGWIFFTNQEQVTQLTTPVLILADQIHDIATLKNAPLPEGTNILAMIEGEDEEVVHAAFAAGADDYVSCPFERTAFLEKTKKFFNAA